MNNNPSLQLTDNHQVNACEILEATILMFLRCHALSVVQDAAIYHFVRYVGLIRSLKQSHHEANSMVTSA